MKTQASPSKFTDVIRINTTSTVIWDALTSIYNWPSWKGSHDRVELTEDGFRIKTLWYTINGVILKSEPFTQFAWVENFPFFQVRYSWTVTELHKQVEVRLEEKPTGITGWLAGKIFYNKLRTSRAQWLNDLKKYCETPRRKTAKTISSAY